MASVSNERDGIPRYRSKSGHLSFRLKAISLLRFLRKILTSLPLSLSLSLRGEETRYLYARLYLWLGTMLLDRYIMVGLLKIKILNDPRIARGVSNRIVCSMSLWIPRSL